MSFGREKRLWLGVLALLAPIPLPFNQVLEWPYFFVYTLFLIHFLQRAENGAWITLSNWVLNLLGLASLPWIAWDFRAAFARGSVVTALAHLMLFLLVVKLYSIRHEKDKWHIMVAIFFLFVGAMATSSHVSILPYLLGFLILGLLVLGRFAHLHVAAPFGEERTRSRTLPIRTPLAAGTLLVALVAVPLFATMPRIREPFILGRGTGGGGMARTTGFSDSVDLSLTSSIRGNRNVAMRVRYDDDSRLGNAADLRFKGAAYDHYRDRRWFRAMRRAEVLIPQATESLARYFDLTPEARTIHQPLVDPSSQPPVDRTPINHAEIFLQPISNSSLLLPMEALSLELDLQTTVGRDLGGAILLPVRPREPLRYRVALGAEPVIFAQLDEDPTSDLSALGLDGLTPRMAELAHQVMGSPVGADPASDPARGEAPPGAAPPGEPPSGEPVLGDANGEPRAEESGALTDDQRIDRLEQHLLTQYAYTLDYLGRDGESPLDDFLFEYKSGHCELFASAMVLMLRSEGIPARLVTGFLGAELNPLEGYYVIRQQNAHAWVEAYTPTRGWRVYDPTPPDGRPSVARQSLKLLLTQIYDFITFRWDRYVLTYGADDQESFFRKMRERMRLFWGKLKNLGEDEPSQEPAPYTVERAAGEDLTSPWVWRSGISLPILLAIFALVAAGLMVWNRRRLLTGQAAYLQLRRRLEHSGLEVSDALAPLELLEQAVARFPNAAGAVRHVVDHYVRESFAGRPLEERERKGLRDALSSAEAELKEHRRQQRRQRRASRAAAPASAG